MNPTAHSAAFDQLTAPGVNTRLDPHSILVLPIGSTQQHGPHLPLSTDPLIADQFTHHLIDRYNDRHDLWALPVLPYGLSLEHAWSPGTISLNAAMFSSLPDTLVGQNLRATGARRLLIVNGHGGNRGILHALVYELQHTHAITVCVIHPTVLAPQPLALTL